MHQVRRDALIAVDVSSPTESRVLLVHAKSRAFLWSVWMMSVCMMPFLSAYCKPPNVMSSCQKDKLVVEGNDLTVDEAASSNHVDGQCIHFAKTAPKSAKRRAPPRFERGASCNRDDVAIDRRNKSEPKARIIPLDHEAIDELWWINHIYKIQNFRSS